MAYPTPPNRPTLHLPTNLPYTRRVPDARRQSADYAEPSRLPRASQPAYPTPAARQTPDATRSADHIEPSLLASQPTYPTPRPGHEKTTKSRSHNNHTPESSL